MPEIKYLDHEGDGAGPESIKSGHLLYALRISNWDGSGLLLLNPLVVDQHGEWEVWHFSPKHPGAFRFRSFAALLEHDIDQLQNAPVRQAERRGDIDGLEAVVLDRSRPDDERMRAAGRLVSAGRNDVAVPALLGLAAPGAPLELRVNALRCLAACRDSRALSALVGLADEDDPHERLLMAAIASLASSHDRRDRRRRADPHRIARLPLAQPMSDAAAPTCSGGSGRRRHTRRRSCSSRTAPTRAPGAPLADLIVDTAIDTDGCASGSHGTPTGRASRP